MAANDPGDLPTPTDDTDRAILTNIEKVSWQVLGIEGDEEGPGFAYSIGMTRTLGRLRE
jgi:hypothetical protein